MNASIVRVFRRSVSRIPDVAISIKHKMSKIGTVLLPNRGSPFCSIATHVSCVSKIATRVSAEELAANTATAARSGRLENRKGSVVSGSKD